MTDLLSNCCYCRGPLIGTDTKIQGKYLDDETGIVVDVERVFHSVCFEDFEARGRSWNLDVLVPSIEAHCALWDARQAHLGQGGDFSAKVWAEWNALSSGRAAVRLPDGSRWMCYFSTYEQFPGALSPALREILDAHLTDTDQHQLSVAHFFEMFLAVPSFDPDTSSAPSAAAGLIFNPSCGQPRQRGRYRMSKSRRDPGGWCFVTLPGQPLVGSATRGVSGDGLDTPCCIHDWALP
jgi:hypothetical protein